MQAPEPCCLSYSVYRRGYPFTPDQVSWCRNVSFDQKCPYIMNLLTCLGQCDIGIFHVTTTTTCQMSAFSRPAVSILCILPATTIRSIDQLIEFIPIQLTKSGLNWIWMDRLHFKSSPLECVIPDLRSRPDAADPALRPQALLRRRIAETAVDFSPYQHREVCLSK